MKMVGVELFSSGGIEDGMLRRGGLPMVAPSQELVVALLHRLTTVK